MTDEMSYYTQLVEPCNQGDSSVRPLCGYFLACPIVYVTRFGNVDFSLDTERIQRWIDFQVRIVFGICQGRCFRYSLN